MNSSFSNAFIRYEILPARDVASADECVLGLHCLGAHASKTIDRVPVQNITAPILEGAGDSLCERWLTDARCRHGQFQDIAFRSTDTLLFGVIELDESKLALAGAESRLRAAAEKAYRQIFSLLDAEGFNYLWRTWNYMPDIHGDECGLERYRQFNIGRHDAFIGSGRSVDRSPAASALGTRGGLFSVAFIAGRSAPTRIENPRQVSAFDYPAQYGPCSPTFTRAATAHDDKHQVLFISGTASIVGHETLHRDDVTAQTQETIANLTALLAQTNSGSSGRESTLTPFTLPGLSYRVYVRHAADVSKVRAVFDDLVGNPLHVIYVQADICRQDLLVEIEAFATRPLAPRPS